MMQYIARIPILYTMIALTATVVNLATQAIVIFLCNGSQYSIELSILAGTLSGLPIKYVLEKKHIFRFDSINFAHDSKLFFLYSFFGIFTTSVFLITEYIFQFIYRTDFMRYLGGAIGLTIGYITKYQLDKKFVFNKQYPNE